jgi:hypothetical protein
MPTTKEKRVTPAGIIEDHLEGELVEAYVAQRHPISGELQDRPLLVVIVDTDDRSGIGTDLSAEIYERLDRYYFVAVCSADEKDDLILPEDEMVPI